MTKLGRKKFTSSVNAAIDCLLLLGLSQRDTDKLHAALQSVFLKLDSIERKILAKQIKRELKE